MTAEELRVTCDQFAETWNSITCSLQEAADAIRRIFESFNTVSLQEADEDVKPPECKFCKKNHIYKNPTPVYKVEKKPPKHLPYQRRYY